MVLYYSNFKHTNHEQNTVQNTDLQFTELQQQLLYITLHILLKLKHTQSIDYRLSYIETYSIKYSTYYFF